MTRVLVANCPALVPNSRVPEGLGMPGDWLPGMHQETVGSLF